MKHTLIAALALSSVLIGCSRSPEPEPVAPPPPAVQESSKPQAMKGKASFYAEKFHGKKTASGEPFNMHADTAAHRTLPLGTKVEVKNLETGQKTRVTINDRGPYVKGRVIDLSKKAAADVGITEEEGVAPVEVKVVETPKAQLKK